MKALIAFDALVVYPGLNEPFKIYTDASDYHMGAVMIQDKRPVACWSRKFSPAQRNDTTIEKELLAVVQLAFQGISKCSL